MPKKAANKKRLVLLDSHAIIHRAYHALPDFTSNNGEPTGALYGLAAMLMKIIDELKPDFIVAAYDLPGPTHRHEVFTEYKAGREKADPDLYQQIERSRDMFAAFNIPILEKPGYEADDVIGTLVEKINGTKGVEIMIASGDMDTLQLVDKKHVQVYTLRKGIKDTVIYDEKAVKERFGFGPELLPDYKGLRGDPSDNIPGVPGIGEKTATALITRFGSLEKIYAQIKKNEDKLLDKGIKPRIINLLKEHEEDAMFSKMLGEIRRDAPVTYSLPKQTWRATLDASEIIKLFHELSFRTLTNRARKLFDLSDTEAQAAATSEGLFATEDDEVSEADINRTAIALWVLDSNQSNADKEEILRFADTHDFEKAKKYIFDELKKQKLLSVFEKIEEPLIPIVDAMETRGVALDTKFLKSLSKKYHTKLDKLAAKIYKHAGEEFNINSPQQLGEVLFDKLGLVGKGKTATGKRSTRESELLKLIDDHAIIQDILDYRELQKLLSTYIDNLPAMIAPADKRLHANFIQNGTTTGRMSSQSPNLQNIPIRTDLGRVVRNGFVPEKGYKLVALDYSQIELRVAAFLSGDAKMIKVFKEGGDIHAAVADEVFGPDDPDGRRKAKVINFGILYGMGVVALGKNIGAKRSEASAYLKAFRERFAGLHEYMEGVKLDAHRIGYTETFFGRRRYFPGIQSHIPYVRAEAERMAANAPLQGIAADIIKLAMIKVDAWLKKEKLQDKVYLVLQVHDELVFEIEEKSVEKVVPKIKELMESVMTKKDTQGVPLTVEAKGGDNWGELEELE